MTALSDLKALALADEAGDCAAMLRALAKNDLVKNAPLAVFTLLKAAAELDERNERVLQLIACIEAADAMRAPCRRVVDPCDCVVCRYDAVRAALEDAP